MTRSDLHPFGNKLRNFVFPNNNLKMIDSDLFDDNLNLESISFTDNQIKSVGECAFLKLQKLSKLRFYGNPCLSQNEYIRNSVVALITNIADKCSSTPQTCEISSPISVTTIKPLDIVNNACNLDDNKMDKKFINLRNNFKASIKDLTAYNDLHNVKIYSKLMEVMQKLEKIEMKIGSQWDDNKFRFYKKLFK